jgi:hypothetical protein
MATAVNTGVEVQEKNVSDRIMNINDMTNWNEGNGRIQGRDG